MTLLILSTSMLSAYRKDLLFSYLGVKEGISQGSVFAILKDRSGYLWFGTSDGLNRYDGYSFQKFHYKVDDPSSLSHNFISALYEDAAGNLWVGTDGGGLNRKERGSSRFLHFRHRPDDPGSIVSDTIQAVCQDIQGNLWVGTNRGLDCLAPGSSRFTHYLPDPADAASIASRDILYVLADGRGRIWIGLRQAGLDCLDSKSGRFAHFRHDAKNQDTLASDATTGACLAPDGMLWISYGARWISRLDPETGKVHHVDLGVDARMIGSVCTDPEGNIWASSGNGLYFLNTASGEVISIRSDPRLPATLITNGLLNAYVDDSDILWVGTSFFGVNKANLKGKRFIRYIHDPTNPNSLGFSFIRGIYENRDGVLYIGGSEGFDRFDRKSGSWRHFYRERDNPISRISSMIYMLCPNSDDPRDLLWISTNGDGIFALDQARQTIRPYPIPELHSRVVYSLYKEGRDSLWIGTEDGLYQHSLKTKETRYIDLKKIGGGDTSGTITGSGVYWIMRDRRGVLWVGTRGLGLLSFDPRTNRWQRYSHDPNNPLSLSSDLVTMMLESKKDEFWISTYGGGINRMNREAGTFEYFTTSQGLANDVAYGMLEDDQGQIWISTNLGLSRFDPATGTFRQFTEEDGLSGNEFNTQAFHSSPWSGQFYFGSTNGLTAFLPREIPDDPHPPRVVLEDFKIFNRSVAPGPGSILKKSIDDTDSISLSYRDSMLTFEFNGLHYIAPAKNRFAYFLEGFDQQWNQTDAFRRYATYTNLSPGHYTLRIKAANSDGVWNERGKSLKIYIAPPFWKTWWFTVLLGAFMVGLLLGIYHYRVRGLQRRKAELEALVTLRTQELKEMSLSDPMTNLRNRRYVSEVVMNEIEAFMQQRQYLLANPQRRLTPIPNSVYGLFIIDVDFFKTVNDRFGHKAGDLFLGEFAGILRENVRQDDVVVRWGGEEFLVILKNCDPTRLPKIAEKIRTTVEANDFLISDTEELRIKSSCCIGIARFPFAENAPGLLTFDQSIILADMAMYVGKESGRNKTTLFEHAGPMPDPETLKKNLLHLETMKMSGFVTIRQYPAEDRA